MERRQSIMRRRGKTFLSLFLSAVIVTGQPVLAADFSAGEETFIFFKQKTAYEIS